MKVVIDAYSGKMTFYDADPQDPILQAYSAAFPNMFVPISKMPAALQAHLRYPPDIFSIQSAIYGRYHLTNSQAFYCRQQRLAAVADGRRRPAVAGAAGGEHLQQPGPAGLHHPGPHGAAVPGVLAAGHGPGQTGLHGLGRLRPGVADRPLELEPELQPDGVDGRTGRSGTSTASSTCTRRRKGRRARPTRTPEISANKTVSSDITLLDQHGSEVLLGETLMVPIANSMVYLRPLYVSPTTNPQPQLQYVVGVLGKNVQIDTSLLERPVRPAEHDRVLPSESGRVLDRHGAGGGGGNPAAGADRLHQRAGRAQGRQPGAVPDRHRRDAAGDRPGAARDRRDDAGRHDDHHHDDGAAGQGQKTSKKTGATTTTTTSHDDIHDDHLGADEHRAQERHDHPPSTTSTTLVSAAPKT